MKILMADDDLDDQLIASLAFKKLNLAHSLDFVDDGEELINYLLEKIRTVQPFPDLILLDLNMPRKDGRAALNEIKTNPELKHLHVIVFSTSDSQKDIDESMSHGANRYIVKKSTYHELMEIFTSISETVVTQPGWHYQIPARPR
ncbi:response regulator [soil metagenome]